MRSQPETLPLRLQGIADAESAAASPPGLPSEDAGVGSILPQAEALFESERALCEYLGILFYSVVSH